LTDTSPSSPPRNGRIVTFYSWKGGAGRTLALANTAIQLCRRGLDVLVVDWDLEAPGLDRYYLHAASDEKPGDRPAKLRRPRDMTGLIGLLSDAAAKQGGEHSEEAWRQRLCHLSVPRVETRSKKGGIDPGKLHLLSSGYTAEGFADRLAEFSWDRFFAEQNGGAWLETLRGQWAADYQFVLIDSRTGRTDSGGVCTIQMPDALVLVFTANEQSLEDGLSVVATAQSARASFPYERSALQVVPLLSRWEGTTEVDLGQQWLGKMEPKIKPLTDAWLPTRFTPRQFLDKLRVRHIARFSFGEPLPVLTHSLTDPDLPGSTFDLLAQLLASSLADAGKIIDPNYVEDLSGQEADLAYLRSLIADPKALEAAVGRTLEKEGETSRNYRNFLRRVSDAALRAGDLTLAEQFARRAVQAGLAAIKASPSEVPRQDNLVRDNYVLGDINRRRGDLSAALAAYQAGMVLADQLAKLDARTSEELLAVGHDRIGDVRSMQGDGAGAIEAYRAGLALDRKLADATGSPEHQRNLSITFNKIGSCLVVQGRSGEAVEAFRNSLAIREQLASQDPQNAELQRDLSVSLERIGNVLLSQGNLEGGLQAHRDSLAIRTRLAASEPDNPGRQEDLSISLERIGDALIEQGDPSEGLKSHRDSLAIRERLAKSAPGNAEWQRALAMSLHKVGSVLTMQGELTEALEAIRAALAINDRLVKSDPDNAEWQRDLGFSLELIGDVYRVKGDLEGAMESYQSSLTTRERLVKSDPSNTAWQRDLASAHERSGSVLMMQGNYRDALRAYRSDLLIGERLAKLDPGNATWQVDVARTHMNISRAAANCGPSLLATARIHLDAASSILIPLQQSKRLAKRDTSLLRVIKRELTKLSGTTASKPGGGRPVPKAKAKKKAVRKKAAKKKR
jgi:tetratricopeptide (TPR) repeat protein